MGGGSPFGGGFDFSGGFADIFSDIFSDFMGGGAGGGKQKNRGMDLRYTLNISLEKAFHGTEEEITFPTIKNCETCHGHGTKDGKEPETCPMCKGRGKVRRQQGGFLRRLVRNVRGQVLKSKILARIATAAVSKKLPKRLRLRLNRELIPICAFVLPAKALTACSVAKAVIYMLMLWSNRTNFMSAAIPIYMQQFRFQSVAPF